MSLGVGARLGHYQVTAKIGEGGMGEVWEATDTKLNRQVALKILPEAFASDPDRLARFQREAQVLASLNHPGIAAIYGIEDSDGTKALVLELVEGPTLADRIAQGPTPVDEALPIAKQIAEALEAAHEQGIIHRDLKPANIKVRPDGTVKVLDFGLAKALAGRDLHPESSDATTVTVQATEAGVVLGTSGYMSPEQARGQPVDRRSDIWSFGCVLYEMLAGCRAFVGRTASDAIAAVLSEEPDWAALPPDAPAPVQRVLRRSLAKDPRRRLRDIGDVRLEIEDATEPDPNVAATSGAGRADPRRTQASLAWAVGGVALLLAPLLVWSYARPEPTPTAISQARFSPLVAEPAVEQFPSWSPDGQSIAYVADVDGVSQVFTRGLGSTVSFQVTQSLESCRRPFWSPDGTRIYFLTAGGLWSIGATGGEAQEILPRVQAAAVAPDGTLAVTRGPGNSMVLEIMPPDASEPQPYGTPPFPEVFGRGWTLDFTSDGSRLAILLDREEGGGLVKELWVIPYPDGQPRRAAGPLYGAMAGGSGLPIHRIDWARDDEHVVMDNLSPDRPGNHLYLVDTVTGLASPLTSGTGNEWQAAVSPDGQRIVFSAGNVDFDLVHVSFETATVEPIFASSLVERWPTWSPTGQQVAYVADLQGAPTIWLRNLEQGSSVPIVSAATGGLLAAWTLNRPTFSPDGERMAYEAFGPGHAVWTSSVAGGPAVRLDADSPDHHSPSWSPDGNWVVYQRFIEDRWELVKRSLSGGEPIALADAPAGGGNQTAWSPTGEWIAQTFRGLRLVSADGHEVRDLGGPNPVSLGFSVDGSRVYAVRRASTGAWELAQYEVESGDLSRVATLDLPSAAVVEGFGTHPDGESFATSVGVARFDIWLLDDVDLPGSQGR